MKKVVPILMSLFLLTGMLISPATAQSIGENFTIKGEQVKIAASETGLYIVRLEGASLAAYQGGVAGLQATSPQATGARKLDISTAASQAYLAFLQAKQADLVNRIEAKLGRSVEVKFQYLAVLNGMAVAMSQAEAQQVASLPGVLTVRPDVLREMDTDVGPIHIGAPTIWEGPTVTGLNTEGEGIVIGMIDSGINSGHLSFAATDEGGYTHTNPYGAGVYHGWCATNPGFCNDKLIGAYNLYTPGTTPEDADGHGSHTASTAGGNRHTANFTVGVDTYDVEIQGVAPHANIVAYKVCSPSCPSTASVEAVELAITVDEVDVLNYSISGSDDPWNDDVDLAFLDANAAGIFVSASAGNAGPGASTVAKTGAWNAAVGASTHERIVANALNVTGPTVPPELQGLAAIPGELTVISADLLGTLKYNPAINDGCTAHPAGYFAGAFALVQRGGCTFAIKEANAAAAGAVGLVVFNNAGGPPSTMGAAGATIPSFMVDLPNGTALKDYVVANPDTTTILITASSEFIYDPGYADFMGSFSSRGPSQFEVLKPDYVAPGVNILAAVAAAGTEKNTYDFYQGTSMSSPHGAGSAALLVALNPTLSPAEIKSMLAASANPDVLLKETGVGEALPFDEGSGLIDLTLAPNIGLVFDETYADYVAANPSIGGDPKTLNQPSMVNYECKGTCTWTRTVTSIASVDTTYTAAYDVPAGMTLTVDPATFTIAPGADQVLTITADVSTLTFDEFAYASVWLGTDDVVTPPATSAVLLSESFTDAAFPPVGWASYNYDTQTTAWARVTDQFVSTPASAKHLFGCSADQEGWLVTPQLSVPAGVASLSFHQRGDWTADYAYHGIMVSTGSGDPAVGDFVQLVEPPVPAEDAWTTAPVSINLSAYAGQSIYVAFLYTGNCADSWWIDDVVVEAVEGVVPFADLKLPVVVVPTAFTPVITVDPAEIASTQGPDTIVEQTLTIGNVAGGADLVWTIDEAPAQALSLDLAAEAPLFNDWAERDASLQLSASGAHASVDTQAPEAGINADLLLSIDDNTVENNIGLTGADWEFIYLNNFTPDPMAFPLTLNQIQVFFEGGTTNVQPGDDISLVVFENTNGNANPGVGAVLLLQQAATVTAVDAWNTYSLTTPLVLDGPGDVLIGVIVLETPGGTYYPAAIDLTLSQHRSWIGAWSVTPPPTPPVLPPNDMWTNVDAYFPGNWLVRGVATFVGPCDNPADVPWLSLDLTAGTTVPGATTPVTVTLDATGLATGTYEANLCVASNDPVTPLVVVPVSMEVLGDPCITVAPADLEQTLPVDGIASQTLTVSNSCAAPADFEIVEAEVPVKVAAELLFEGFEGGVMPPAGGWETFHRGATTRPWQVTATPSFVYEGTYAGWVNYDSAAASDEWLLTPVIDTTNLLDLELHFMAQSDTDWPTATMKVWVTDAEGVPLTADPIWDLVRDEVWEGTFDYHEIVEDLSAYDGTGEIRIAWQYVGQDGDSFGLDNITLLGTEPPFDNPWLSEDPLAGTVPAGGSVDVTVTFDATGLAVGDYTGLLKVINLPYTDIDVPVLLHVIDMWSLYLPLIMK